MGTLAHGPLEFKPHLCGDGGRLATEVDAARIGSSRMISGPPPPAPICSGGAEPRLELGLVTRVSEGPHPVGQGTSSGAMVLELGFTGWRRRKLRRPQKKRPWAYGGGKQTQKLSKLFKPFRNATTLLKHFQTSSNLFETLQNFSKPFQTFSNLFKPLLAL